MLLGWEPHGECEPHRGPAAGRGVQVAPRLGAAPWGGSSRQAGSYNALCNRTTAWQPPQLAPKLLNHRMQPPDVAHTMRMVCTAHDIGLQCIAGQHDKNLSFQIATWPGCTVSVCICDTAELLGGSGRPILGSGLFATLTAPPLAQVPTTPTATNPSVSDLLSVCTSVLGCLWSLG